MENNKTQEELVDTDDLYLAEIEKRTLIFPKIMQLAVSNTLQADWVDFGGKAWLKAPGAERVARALGFTIKDTRREREDRKDEKGDYYLIIWYGKIGLEQQNMWVDAIGLCSSRKPFWFIDKGRERMISEIREENIIRDAFSNLIENGVTRFLGLRGLPWEVLKKAGISQEKAEKVDFEHPGGKEKGPPKGKAKKQPPKKEPKPPETPPDQPKQQPMFTKEQYVQKLMGEILDLAVEKILATRDEIKKAIPSDIKIDQLQRLHKSLKEISGEWTTKDFKGLVKGAIYVGGK